MGWFMIAYINGLFSKPPAKLRNIGDSYMIEGPEHILVKRDRAFYKPNLNTVHQQLILAIEILLRDPIKQIAVFLF